MAENKMKAVVVRRFGGPEVLEVEEVEIPRPGPGEVLVRVRAAGVNPVETYIRAGVYARLPELPFTPGSDAGGEVVEVGGGAGMPETGSRVYTSGSRTGIYADYAVCEARHVHPLPDPLSFEQGAALGVPYATAFRALFQRGEAREGEWVLVHGATGGVGLAAVQLARDAGLRVLGTGGSPEGRAEVEAQGAEVVLDHSADGYLQGVRDATGGRGVDLILEMLANENLGRDLPLLAPRGRVVVIGSRGPVEITPRDLMARDASIVGMLLGGAGPDEQAEIHRALGARAQAGAISPIIGERFPLDQAGRAHERVMAGAHRGKIVLLP